MNKRELGAKKEDLAVKFLEAKGVRIVQKNFRCRQGEIDIIGYHNEYLIFVEVKYRSSTQYGTPQEAVGMAKQRTICKVADYYRYRRGISEFSPIRYDVVSMMGEQITWHQNAFMHIGR